jgi:tRNA pseudouridine38-40 synthase
MVFRMKLVIAYLGTPFHGWQRQRGQRTVQGELERALSKCVGGTRICVAGAGRTDSGVHAAGQTAHCDLPGRIPPERLVSSLNAILPREIRLRSARPVGDSFHAQKSALGKLYIYRLRWREPLLPWLDLRSAAVAPVADIEATVTALSLLQGTRDWASFTVPDPGPQSTIRTLYEARLIPRRFGAELRFIGDGFLRYQVRRMVGAVLEVGRGRRDLDSLRRLLDHPTPGASIHTAPAAGLCLEKVYYRHSRILSNRSWGSRS